MNCIFKVLRNLFFTQVSKYFPKNLRLKILLIVQRVVQIVIPETSPLPPRQCEVWEDWQFREGPQSERHGGVGGRAVEADDVVEDGTEAEAVLECDWLAAVGYLSPTMRAEVKSSGVRSPNSWPPSPTWPVT